MLGSSGGEGHRKHLRVLAKEAEKTAREAAEAARKERFSQPEPLSPQFQFLLRMHHRCAVLPPCFAKKRGFLWEVRPRQRSGMALTVQQLRLMGSCGLLLHVLLQLSRHSRSKTAATMRVMILARVSARRATPEVCFARGTPILTASEAV